MKEEKLTEIVEKKNNFGYDEMKKQMVAIGIPEKDFEKAWVKGQRKNIPKIALIGILLFIPISFFLHSIHSFLFSEKKLIAEKGIIGGAGIIVILISIKIAIILSHYVNKENTIKQKIIAITAVIILIACLMAFWKMADINPMDWEILQDFVKVN